jgi:hypothetical protein
MSENPTLQEISAMDRLITLSRQTTVSDSGREVSADLHRFCFGTFGLGSFVV